MACIARALRSRAGAVAAARGSVCMAAERWLERSEQAKEEDDVAWGSGSRLPRRHVARCAAKRSEGSFHDFPLFFQ